MTLYAIWTANQYIVSFESNGGSKVEDKTVTFGELYGELENSTKTGYVFGGWYLEPECTTKIEETTIVTTAKDHILYANWLDAENTPYTVIHRLQSLENETTFEVKDTETLYGKTNSVVTPETKSYKGFTAPAKKQLTITADGKAQVIYDYTRNIYTLTLDKNEYISSVSQSGNGTYKYEQEVTINAVLGNETGYTYSWENWTKGAEEFDSTQQTTFKMPAEDLILKANASRVANKYTVTYDVKTNGGETQNITQTVSYGDNVDLSKTATKTGYKFVGWNTNANAHSGLESYKMPAGNVTLYAIYSKDIVGTYVDYSGTTKTPRTETITIYNNETGTITVPSQNTYTGWTSLGWTKQTDSGASVEITSAGGKITGVTENVTYYGLYQKEVNVKYNLNGGTGTEPNPQKAIRKTNSYAIASIQTESIVIAENTGTKVGYSFKEWNTNADGKGEKYTPGMSATITEDTQLYAIWQANTNTAYTVKHMQQELNGKYTVVETENLTGTTGSKVTPKVKTYGGYTSPSTQTVEIKADGSTVVEYKYNLIVYQISYNLNGGTVSNNPNRYTVKTENIKLNNPTKEGYTFTGWTGSNGTTAQTTVTIPKGSTGNKNYTANWKANQYVVSFETYGGSKVEDKTVTFGGTYGTLSSSTKVGYVFGGWYLEPEYRTKIESSTKVTIAKNHTLYAQWLNSNETPYTIYHYVENANDTGYTLNKTTSGKGTTGATIVLSDLKQNIENVTYQKGSLTAGGTAVEETTIKADGSTKIYLYYTRNKYTLTLNRGTGIASVTGAGTYKWGASIGINATIAEKSGYTTTWKNWTNGNNVYSTTKNATITMPANHLTLTANATRTTIEYDISYDLNGGTLDEEIPNYTVETGDITLGEPEKEGYTFEGWTGSNGDTPEKEVTIPQGSTGDKEYVANWTANQYTLTYISEGKSIGTKKVTYDKAYGELLVPTRKGYNFKGWYKEEGYTNKVEETTIVKTASNHNVYAKWEAQKYTVTYNANGGTGAPGSQEKVYGQTLKLSETKPNKTGYTFKGWGLSATATTVAYQPGATMAETAITKDTVLYAIWEANTYTIEYNGNGATGGSTASSTHKYDEERELTANGYQRKYTVTYNYNYTGSTAKSVAVNYTFNGWATTATGEVKYQDKEEVTNLATTGKVTLYANWTSNSTTLETPTRT